MSNNTTPITNRPEDVELDRPEDQVPEHKNVDEEADRPINIPPIDPDNTPPAAPKCCSKEKNLDTHPYKRWEHPLDGQIYWIRNIDRPVVEFIKERSESKWFHHLSSIDKTDNRLMKDCSKSQKIARPGNSITKIGYKVLQDEKTGQDRWSAHLLTWETIMNLVDQYRQADEKLGETPKDPEGEFKVKNPKPYWQAWFKAKNKQEMFRTEDAVKKDDGSNDLVLASVFDGHSGSMMAQLLKDTLHGCLVYALGQAYANIDEEDAEGQKREIDPEEVCKIIRDTYKAVDEDFIKSPLKLLRPDDEYKPSSLLPPQPPSILGGPLILPAGSTAVTAIYDSRSGKVFIANAGDCRAVAGWYNHKEKKWRCDILTNDFNGDNPDECTRIENGHLEEERGNIMIAKPNMRIFGQLHPTRGFGDHLYKWAYRDWVDYHNFYKQCYPDRTWKREYREKRKTPPYSTAEPEVVWRDLKANEDEELKFIILATDGLWDKLTSEEAFLLTACTYKQYSVPDPNNNNTKQLYIDSHFPGLEDDPAEKNHPYPQEKMNKDGHWDFRKETPEIRLVRDAFGGSDIELRNQLLSLAPTDKSMKDDVTVLVLRFGDVRIKDPKPEEASGPA